MNEYYDTLLPEIKAKSAGLFNGTREMVEHDLVRRSLNILNGEFVLTLTEADNVDYDVDTPSRVLTGLFPMNVEELVYYYLCAVPCFLPNPFPSFVRELFLDWIERSPLFEEKARVEKCLDYFGVK